MPAKTEAEIARPYQEALDESRRELLEQKQTSIKELHKFDDALKEKDAFYIAQIEEMKDALRDLDPEKITELEKNLDEQIEQLRIMRSALGEEIRDHRKTEDKLKECLDQLLAADEVRIEMRTEIEELKKKIPTPNAPGRPRTRRSQRG